MINIIHLSDIHFRTDINIEQNKVITGFVDDMKLELGSADKIKTFILITGDITQSANPLQYEAFQNDFLDLITEKVGVPLKNMFFVPGNHDLDRTLINVEHRITSTFKSQTEFNNYIDSNRFEKSILTEKFQSYLTFLNKIQPEIKGNASYCSFKILNKINVLGINTALCSHGGAGDFDDRGQGVLHVNTREVENWLNNIRENEKINIIMMHHPIESLSYISRVELKKIIKNSHIPLYILSGHVHNQDVSQYISEDNNIVFCESPQLFANDRNEGGLGYSILHLDDDLENLQYVTYRKWSSSTWEFVKGVEFAKDGVYTFNHKIQNVQTRKQHKFDYVKATEQLLNNTSLIQDDYLNVIRALEQIKNVAKEAPEVVENFLCKYIQKRAKIKDNDLYYEEIRWLSLPSKVKEEKMLPFDIQLAFNYLFKECSSCFGVIANFDFKNLALYNINFDGMKVSNVDFSHSFMQHAKMFKDEKKNTEPIFDNCIFNNTFLDAAHMHRATFNNCKFINTNMRWANMYGVSLTNCQFINCDMEGVVLSNAQIDNCVFKNCDLSASEIKDINLKTEILFESSQFCFASFFVDSETENAGLKFRDCDFTGVERDPQYYNNHGRIKRFLIYSKNIKPIDARDTNRAHAIMKYYAILKTLKAYCLPNCTFDEEKEINLFIDGRFNEII